MADEIKKGHDKWGGAEAFQRDKDRAKLIDTLQAFELMKKREETRQIELSSKSVTFKGCNSVKDRNGVKRLKKKNESQGGWGDSWGNKKGENKPQDEAEGSSEHITDKGSNWGWNMKRRLRINSGHRDLLSSNGYTFTQGAAITQMTWEESSKEYKHNVSNVKETNRKKGKLRSGFPAAAMRMDTLNDIFAASDLISLHYALNE
ncbi:hypothetical protein Tco_0684364 [Tanacetum coccineum]